jgi:ribosomal protein S12 methylthiotransferase
VTAVYIHTLGCARNLVDSETLASIAAGAGHTITAEPEAAEVILVHTCSFIESAINESIDAILELAAHKKSGACSRLIVAGCLPERFREPIAEALPEVDAFLGTGALDRALSAIEGRIGNGQCVLPFPDGLCLAGDQAARKPSTYPVAYLKIAEGCNRSCTYCIIPRLKGRLKSRPPEDIRAEAELRSAEGYAEITLIAQDTSAYGKDLDPPASLAGLLGQLGGMPGSNWLRFLYGSPDYTDEGLIRTVAAHPRILPYFDVPVQHASGRILKRMGRSYGKDTLKALFERIRRILPASVLRTTLLVGFPGETEEDFRHLMHFIEEVRFDHIGVFVYSDAEDLASHHLQGHVPAPVAADRRDRLMARQAEISLEHNRSRVGGIYPVLIEDRIDSGLYLGRAPFQAPEVDGVTYVAASDLSIGEFVDVRICEAYAYDLTGELACPV